MEQGEHEYFATPGGVTTELVYVKSEVDSSIHQCLHNEALGQHMEMTAHGDSTKLNTFPSDDQIDHIIQSNGVTQLQKIDVDSCPLPVNPTLSDFSNEVKVAYPENLLSSIGDGINGCAGSAVQAVEVKNEISGHYIFDDLDHIALKERQRMLLSRNVILLRKPVLENIPRVFSEDVMQELGSQEKGEACTFSEVALMATNEPYDNPITSVSLLSRSMSSSFKESIVGSSSKCTTNLCLFDLAKSNDDRKCSEGNRMCPSETKLSLFGGQDDVPTCTSKVHPSVQIKDEPLDNSDFPNLARSVRGNISLNMLPVKHEPKAFSELGEDEVDHMLLRDRMNLLASRDDSSMCNARNYGCFATSVPSAHDYSPIAKESCKPVSISRPRKKRKTDTDSVETALEEDAPGLLQVLMDKGVLVDEIKLYGEMENDEALDESFCEDSFGQLEAVISKLFSQRQSILKIGSIRCAKEARASYCLACLFSLVDQAQHLQFKNWPVEWGWCRDLQSFIFVFARHNRIVVERPEYGYATYFFELVDSLPIDWQIKRLVTAMKLTSCSRLSLIENKALTVGDDLSEGEAKVLLEYGWEPNTGLGTMLKYCDRVMHDRKNESESSEWRSKIGKMLMDGYNGGTLVLTNLPKKVVDCREAQCPETEIKLEL